MSKSSGRTAADYKNAIRALLSDAEEDVGEAVAPVILTENRKFPTKTLISILRDLIC